MKKYINEVAKKSMKPPALKDHRFPGRDQDQLFKANYPHAVGEDCSGCNLAAPKIYRILRVTKVSDFVRKVAEEKRLKSELIKFSVLANCVKKMSTPDRPLLNYD